MIEQRNPKSINSCKDNGLNGSAVMKYALYASYIIFMLARSEGVKPRNNLPLSHILENMAQNYRVCGVVMFTTS